jgi:hypothetical protein
MTEQDSAMISGSNRERSGGNELRAGQLQYEHRHYA